MPGPLDTSMGYNSPYAISQAGSQFRPLASGLHPTRFNPFDSLPESWGLMGQAGNMAIGMGAPMLMQQYGFRPGGMSNPQNFYDNMAKENFYKQYQDGLQATRRADEENYNRFFRGVARLTGTPEDEETRNAATRLSNTLTMASPFLAESNPELLEALNGRRGSGVVMADRMMKASRYRFDPLTGKYGQSAESAAAMANELFQASYGERADLGAMRGITAGQYGAMFSELQARGMVGTGTLTPQQLLRETITGLKPDQLKAALKEVGVTRADATAENLTAREIDLLGSSSSMGQKMRSLNTQKIKQGLDQYVDAVAAMKEIFGDAGNPNAPMPELIQGLEALTAGSMHQVEPEKLATLARRAYYGAKDAGMDTNALMAIGNDMAARAQQIGIESPFAMTAQTNAISFSAAYRGHNMAATPVFGGMTADALAQASGALQLQASSSVSGNLIGAIQRMQADGHVKKGSSLDAAAKAIQEHKTTFIDSQGKERNLYELGASDIYAMGKESGMDANQVRVMLNNTSKNRESLFKTGADRDVMQLGIIENVKKDIKNTTASILGADFVGEERDKVSKLVSEAYAGLGAGQVRDDKTRRAALIQKLAAGGVEKTKAKSVIDLVDEELQGQASSPNGSIFRQLGGKTLADNLSLINPDVMRAQRQIERETDVKNDIRGALAGQTGGGWIANLTDAVRDLKADTPDKVANIAFKALGGMDKAKQEKLGKMAQDIIKKRQEAETLGLKIHEAGGTATNEMREDYAKRLKDLQNKGAEFDSLITTDAEKKAMQDTTRKIEAARLQAVEEQKAGKLGKDVTIDGRAGQLMAFPEQIDKKYLDQIEKAARQEPPAAEAPNKERLKEADAGMAKDQGPMEITGRMQVVMSLPGGLELPAMPGTLTASRTNVAA